MSIVRYKLDPNNLPQLTPEQEARLEAMTPEEIERNALEDPDNPPSTDEELDRGVFARDVRMSRERLAMTQERFAEALGVPIATLRDWEDGRINPDPAARALMIVVAADPEGALEALAARSDAPVAA